jgi:hypothetical protein
VIRSALREVGRLNVIRAEVGLHRRLDQPEPYVEDEEGPNLVLEFPDVPQASRRAVAGPYPVAPVSALVIVLR